MAEIRGDKVVFRKEEIASLDDMPSCRAEDALIVHCPPPRRRHMLLLKGLVVFVAVAGLGLVGLFASIESGVFDRELARRAELALNGVMDGTFRAKVGGAALRFSSRMSLAIEARDVELVEAASGEHVTHTQSVRLVIDPLALLGGRLSIGGLEADGVEVDTALLQRGGSDLAALRVDELPAILESVFLRLDGAFHFLERTQTGDISLSKLTLRFPGDGKPVEVEVNDLLAARRGQGIVQLSGVASYGGDDIDFTVQGHAFEGRVAVLEAKLEGLDLGQLTVRTLPDGTIHDGLASEVEATITARRGEEDSAPVLSATVRGQPGQFYMDGDTQEFGGAEINLAYDFTKRSLEFVPSRAVFGDTVLPFTGAIIDRDQIEGPGKAGFALDFLFDGAVSGATEARPLPFNAKATGSFDPVLRELRADQLFVTSPQGNMAGSFLVRFRQGMSPEISFGGQVPEMTGEAVKQLWPFWVARKPREWAVANLFGGKIRNGVVSVFIPAGRMRFPPVPVQLDENELHIAFDVEHMRLDLPPDIPPVRDMDGHVDIRGEKTEVTVANGVSYFGSGRSVKVENSRFHIADAYLRPLSAEISLNVAGDAAAVLELSSFKPMNSLKDTDFRPEDFSGPVRAGVSARFGLLQSQSPPPPEWSARIDLQSVDVHRDIAGRRLAGAKGTIDVTPQAFKVEAKADVDGAPLDISYAQPLGKAGAQPALAVRGRLEKRDWLKLAPQLGGLVEGPLSFELSRVDEKKQTVAVDLSAASLSLPWIGWSKGAGVPAKGSFDLTVNGAENLIRNFQIGGDGFGAEGGMTFNKGGLVAADLSRVQLSPGDDFSATLRAVRGGHELSVNGRRIDARHVINKLKTDYEGEKSAGGDGDTGSFAVTLNVDRLAGFNDEELTGVSARYAMKAGTPSAIDFKGVTGSGQAIVSEMLNDGRGTISVTSGDAGAFARFIDLYKNMNGGLLNLRLAAMDAQSWSGSIDLRSFRLSNEQRLQSIVSTPAGQSGQSLNSAVKRDIDVSSAGFQRAFARIIARNGVLAVENGVLRGEQVGATFQGTVRDGRGNMDLTGTFMPAYGLNRLFAELPIIGTILGNGRDRGLIGITFRMTGKFTQPNLSVNPLSIIAPGVFRQIFEY
ncbi:DUF3971 domain-containing protein [Rhizobiaceae bacterium BDR2-2]|uniref:DUF3971 domain-containing protein n=1 Tax=Ectorhizobium quercum TaxID=2965071 RepID=A0AAE3MYX0_9HYPH|nr:DUF3971 domain-containing protein [Ectorhizobium quercum]MCX8997803.1 DUF3971 domain-containing protein [Ectorhizobium quercum]